MPVNLIAMGKKLSEDKREPIETADCSLHSWNDDDKPRERLLRSGVRSLSDAEILAIMLRTGVPGRNVVELSKDILAFVGNDLDRLARLSVRDFMANFKGVGEAKAISLVAALELGRRRGTAAARDAVHISGPDDIADYFRPLLMDLDHEEFHILMLNRAHNVIDSFCASNGGVSGTVVDMKLIFRRILTYSASSIALCHNHPSCSAQPSREDEAVTAKIKAACGFHDINLIDHIIIGGHDYYSFADEGRL